VKFTATSLKVTDSISCFWRVQMSSLQFYSSGNHTAAEDETPETSHSSGHAANMAVMQYSV
jgi:hypothetical protein